MAKRKAKKTAKKPQKVWLARDDDVSPYELYTTKPKKDELGGFYGSGPKGQYLKGFCPSAFEDYTGFTLSPGECCRVLIHIEKV